MESSTPFESSAGVYKWLEGFINLERDLSSRPMRLETMKSLASFAANPETCAPAIHIAGSKGKGSVNAIIAAILEAAGYRTCRYTSPHVRDFRERITLGNDFLDERIYSEAGNLLREASRLCIENGKEPSYFELFTLWFFLCSRISKAEAMAVETGLGGRLDATNILNPQVSVITVIEKEHTEILGDTLEKIAWEKAGIIKPERPLVLAEQKREALDVFMQKTKETGSPLYYFPEICEINSLRIDRDGTTFDLALSLPSGKLDMKELRISVPGEIQAGNAGLAALAIRITFPEIKEDAVRKGLAAFKLPARFERIADDPVFIIDGAHTALSAGECFSTFTGLYDKGGILLFGCAADKDVQAIASLAVRYFSRIIITTPGSFKKSFPQEVYESFSRLAAINENKPEILYIPETKAALELSFELGKKNKLPVLGTGSFYLAAEISNLATKLPRAMGSWV